MKPLAPLNRAVWSTTVVLTVTLAVSGLHHGVFEVLQGNRPTPGLFIESIGPEQVRWMYGTDGAFTLLPTYLATGVAAIGVSLLLIAWAAFGLSSRRGPSVLLALFVLLTLVGGGIGHIPFFLALAAYATRIRKPLDGWRRLGPRLRAALARAWLPTLALAALTFLAALEVSVFGYPPLADDPERLLNGIWLILLASFLLLNAAYAGAAARDLQRIRAREPSNDRSPSVPQA